VGRTSWRSEDVSLPQHLECLDQTKLHTIERRCDTGDLIASLHRYRRQVHLPLTDAISSFRHQLQRPNHDEIDRSIQNDDGRDQSDNKANEQEMKRLFGVLHWQRHGDRNDLGSYDRAWFPPKAVVGPVAGDHGGRSR
jgi:hypothetical protein